MNNKSKNENKIKDKDKNQNKDKDMIIGFFKSYINIKSQKNNVTYLDID